MEKRIPLRQQMSNMESALATVVCVALLWQVVASSDDVCIPLCKCYTENGDPLVGKLYNVDCTGLGLTKVPDLGVLKAKDLPKAIILSRNDIESVANSDFPHGLKIVKLELNENKGIRIDEDAFVNLGPTLKKLYIEAVDFAFDRTMTMLDSLYSLEFLSLSHNNKHPYVKGAVHDVNVPLFRGQMAKSLKKLKLAFCGMKSMGANTLDTLVNLEEIDLSNNLFSLIPAGIKHLRNLKTLTMFYCQISSLKNYDFENLGKVEELDFSSNKLKTVESKAFHGLEESLKMLGMQRCDLKEIPSEAIRKLKKLVHLDISENAYTKSNADSFKGDYCLQVLVISSPGLVIDPDIFSGQASCLIDVTIQRMGLTSVPRAPLMKLTKLKRLSLENNKITTLQKDAFSGLKTSHISVSENPLSKIEPGAFNGLPDGLAIKLRRTNMADLDFVVGYPDSAIHSINMEFSDLRCSCSMKSVVNASYNIFIFSSCTMGAKDVSFTSSEIEDVAEQACVLEHRQHEEAVGANRNPNNGTGSLKGTNFAKVVVAILCVVLTLALRKGATK